MPDKTSVAVLGTGIMGSAMARNLAGAGLDVRAWNRTRAKAEPLAADGVRVVDTPAEAVDGADAVLTVLLDGPAVLDAMRQSTPALRAKTLWLQMSTVGADGVDPLAAFAREHGLDLVDAPVLGTKEPAEKGLLTVLAAGPQEVRDRAGRILDVVGQRTLWLGEDAAAGTASRLKLAVNSWVLTVINGTGEALALAQGLGVDPRALLDAVAGGPLDLPYLRMKSELILSGDYPASFTVSAARKDARLIAEAAERAGVRMDLATAAAERFRRAEEQGHGDEDGAAAYFASFDG
ncbi:MULTISPECIES: NAD(P)-dependent oxidoreductase [Streptomyces]|uniref:NAD(P)-dependent oxidoreductase n=2 Tax=Streptomyces rimosus subsp. rimosus TaxID=132474 RepID=A0A8A1UM50_STRR1|nr:MULTISPECIES: NAD(P)-dependent oxidoreductase [Streptomyces]KOG70910.1 3-hydroxyisobutyrate dehydrogenase [Kitasatospora aureofaciens]KEF05825.1 3-hydroxyisobutyrate dehydrogenase [Streptomyces rimosus]KEF20529.1 3-hydroxyisobutyrate dehydrogenase [Streptomyces rimosus]KOT31801.1 3-hydroxyisobutyrate dehydrogenase [Streptomyces rimosus subsp. rimosus]KOT33033.1 3-hydroxyisobutyrate dehydrogenase [Streptomyces sp. NRRL WC-3701]